VSDSGCQNAKRALPELDLPNFAGWAERPDVRAVEANLQCARISGPESHILSKLEIVSLVGLQRPRKKRVAVGIHHTHPGGIVVGFQGDLHEGARIRGCGSVVPCSAGARNMGGLLAGTGRLIEWD
jgi:hypothetical protein